MPIENSTAVTSITPSTAAISLTSNSPLQIVPCSPYIGTVTSHNSPAAMVPNMRRLTQTPDIGHLVPQTPDNLDRVDSRSSRSWSLSSTRVSSPPQGEQLVPQTPSSSSKSTTPCPSHVERSTPQRSIHRKPRKLPVSSEQDDTQPRSQLASQIDLFRGSDIFG